ncbi:fanconi-associated nuclease 1-like isoform X1 [Vespula squamosa]|uniref:Fanconi-associated nuclease n=1 Tax=Vespula squamosa TaxID=30214 RepID=A0ABD2C6K2_VESSQ
MSIQTNLDQFFKQKLKNTRKVKSQKLVGLKELKRLKKQSKNIKSHIRSGESNERKHFSSINTSSFHTNKSIDNAQIVDTGTHFMVGMNTTYASEDLNNKTDVLSDCSIIYEKICTSSNKISTDKKEATEYGNHVIKDSEKICINSQLQSFEKQVSSSHNDNELTMPFKLFEEGNNRRFSVKDSKILDTEHNDISKGKYSISSVYSSPVKNVLNSPSNQRNLSFIPKKSSTEEVLPHNSKIPENLNLYFRQIVDKELTHTAIENMNLVKEGVILANNFDLQKIYAASSFTFKYNRIDTRTSEKYEYNDVIIPTETYAALLFMIVVNVFSNPINCGYFDKDETDFIFSMFTLSVQAQMLFARILKRKYSWHRVKHLKYKNLADDMIPIYKELVSKSFFISDIDNEELSTSFKMLQADEIRTICKDFKLTYNNKEKSIKKLLEIAAKKPLFPGMKSSGDRLKSLISNKLGYCIRLNQKAKDIFDKVLTLLIPNQEPQETLSDTYNKLMQIDLKKMFFPKFSDKRYPLFSNKNQLIRYIEAKHKLTGILNAIENKQWETVREIGKLAYDQWLIIMGNECTSLENYVLPSHISRFMPGYLWLKILSKSIDAFKKVKETLPFAIEILHKLINQNFYMQRKKEAWYAELALIEMYHNRNLEASAKITLESLKIENLSEVGTAELVERAKKLVKRKTGISNTTLANIKITLKFMESNFTSSILNTTVEATLMKGNFGTSNIKSKWCIDNTTNNKFYSSVENVALNFYYNQGFNDGIHCEGALPITLFFALFWEELFNIDIPGTFVTLYQTAPLDLFTKDFYKNRKETIDMKLKLLRSFDSETFCNLVENNFISNSHFESMMHVKMFTNNNIKEIVYCLGTENVIKICERLIHNYTLWKAGFPDLIVWNSNNKSCKIIEVKGPGDKLSVKQTLWLQYLHQMGVNVEVCLVRDNGKIKMS